MGEITESGEEEGRREEGQETDEETGGRKR